MSEHVTQSVESDAIVQVTSDDLAGWVEDAITQGIAPATYIFNVLSAALSEGDDMRPVDLNAVIELLGEEIDNGGEEGIWGDYGPPSAPLGYLIRLLTENADAIENGTGAYKEDNDG